MTVRLLQGHVLDVLKTLPTGSCHISFCSPPYWRQRAYQTRPQTWATDGAVCELGSESTVDSYLAHLVEVFAAVKRVLRDDGTCWVNLNTSYLTDPGGQNGSLGAVSARAIAANAGAGRQQRVRDAGDSLNGLGAGNLLLIPSMFGLAMQQDGGWDLRQVITYAKLSPLPESVSGWEWRQHQIKVGRGVSAQRVPRPWDVGEHAHDEIPAGYYAAAGDGASVAQYQDCPGCPTCTPNDGLVLRRGRWRPTTATEQVLLFCKRGARYYADPDQVREPNSPGAIARFGSNPAISLKRKYDGMGGISSAAMPPPEWRANGHNLWNWQVWPTAESKSTLSHWASFPPGLPRLAIEACAPLYACGTCGAGWARVVKTPSIPATLRNRGGGAKMDFHSRSMGGGQAIQDWRNAHPRAQQGFRPTCTCTPAVPVPSTVLDPFSGTGTTCMESDRLGREAIGIELSAEYHRLAQAKVRGDAPLFVELETEMTP